MEEKPIVLVLDDDADEVEALAALLESSGFQARAARDGREALKIVEKDHPPVGLVDLMLPGMNGLEVVEEIGKKSPDTECIILTAFASSESAIKAISLGAYSYMTKPYAVDQLLLTIRRAFEKHETDEAFRNSEEKYRALFENVHEAIMLSDLKSGQVIDINEEAVKLLHRSRKEMRGVHRSDLYSEDMRDRYESAFLEHISMGHPGDFEAEVILGNAERLPVHVRTLMTTLGDRKVVQSIMWDATERKKIEETISEIIAGDERLRRFLIGREMKLVEMKKEVNALHKKMGKEEKYLEESSIVEEPKK